MSKCIVVSDLGPVRLKKGCMMKLGVPAPSSESDELAQPTTKSWIFREVPGSVLKFWHCFPKGVIFHRKELPLKFFIGSLLHHSFCLDWWVWCHEQFISWCGMRTVVSHEGYSFPQVHDAVRPCALFRLSNNSLFSNTAGFFLTNWLTIVIFSPSCLLNSKTVIIHLSNALHIFHFKIFALFTLACYIYITLLIF